MSKTPEYWDDPMLLPGSGPCGPARLYSNGGYQK